MTAPRARGQLTAGQSVALLVIGLGVMFGGFALGALLRMASQGVAFDEGWRQVTAEPLGLGLAQLVALGVVILLGVRIAHGDAGLREALTIRPIAPQAAILAMIAGLSFQFPLVELTTLVSDMVPSIAFREDDLRAMEQLTRIDGPLRALAVPLTFVLIAPVTEELVFRGLMLPSMSPRLGSAGALVMTSVLFGVFHMHPMSVIFASIAGMLLGAIALRTGSVLAPIAFHAAFNAVPLLVPAQVLPIQGFNVGHGDHLPMPIVLGTSLASVIALYLLWRITSDEEPTS